MSAPTTPLPAAHTAQDPTTPPVPSQPAVDAGPRATHQFQSRRRLDFSQIHVEKPATRLTERQQMALLLKNGSVVVSDESNENTAPVANESELDHESAKSSSQQKRRRNPATTEPTADDDGPVTTATSKKKRPTDFHTWSGAKQRAWEAIDTNPNAYYYRNTHPGVKQSFGKWTDEQHSMFMDTLKKHNPNIGQWGIFASMMLESGRVGYQCRNYYHQLLSQGLLKDEDYLDEHGKYSVKKVRRSLSSTLAETSDSIVDETSEEHISAPPQADVSCTTSQQPMEIDEPQTLEPTTLSDSQDVRTQDTCALLPAPSSPLHQFAVMPDPVAEETPFEVPKFEDDDLAPEPETELKLLHLPLDSAISSLFSPSASSPVHSGAPMSPINNQCAEVRHHLSPASSSPQNETLGSSSPVRSQPILLSSPARSSLPSPIVDSSTPESSPLMLLAAVSSITDDLLHLSDTSPPGPSDIPIGTTVDPVPDKCWTEDAITVDVFERKRRAFHKPVIDELVKLVPTTSALDADAGNDADDVVPSEPTDKGTTAIASQLEAQLLNTACFLTRHSASRVGHLCPNAPPTFEDANAHSPGMSSGSEDEVEISRGTGQTKLSGQEQRLRILQLSHLQQQDRLLVTYEQELERSIKVAALDSVRASSIVKLKGRLLQICHIFAQLQDDMLARHAQELACLHQQHQYQSSQTTATESTSAPIQRKIATDLRIWLQF